MKNRRKFPDTYKELIEELSREGYYDRVDFDYEMSIIDNIKKTFPKETILQLLLTCDDEQDREIFKGLLM